MRVARLALCALLAAALAGWAACAPAGADPGRETVLWREVGQWTGRTSVQTESFLNQSGALRLRWQTRPLPGAEGGSFRLTFHSAVSGRPLGVAVDARGAGGDMIDVTEDPRPLYVVVEASGVEWEFGLAERFTARAH